MKPTPTMTGVRGCARCGYDHPDITFYKLNRPSRFADLHVTQFATCPISGQPIFAVNVPSSRIKRFWSRLRYAFNALRGR